jgi:hypothetical protein
VTNRLVFSIRFSTKVLLKLARLSLLLVLYMSLLRLNFYFLVVFHGTSGLSFVEVFHSLTTGIRFDLLIFGFLLAPLYLIVMIQGFAQKWPRFVFRFYQFYMGVSWFIICLLTYIDFFHFTEKGRRMRFADYLQWSPEVLQSQWHSIHPSQVWLFTALLFVLLIFGISSTKAVTWGDWKDEYSPEPAGRLEIGFRVVIPLLLIVLAARGTIQAHHLELQHSLVSESTFVNEMALNAVWCFDK